MGAGDAPVEPAPRTGSMCAGVTALTSPIFDTNLASNDGNARYFGRFIKLLPFGAIGWYNRRLSSFKQILFHP